MRTDGLAVARVADQVLRTGIEVELLAGHALAITGPNGAGKSTLGLTLAGLLPPVAGAVLAEAGFADGAGPHPIRWKSRQLLTRIGTVFQQPEHQFLTSTVHDELAVGPRALKLPTDVVDERVEELLERLRLARLAGANPFTLSGGEKRRLSVATVLATRPRVMVLDEPTFGQDALTWRELVLLLGTLLDEGRSVVAVTHDTEFIDALATSELHLSPQKCNPERLEVTR